MCNCACKFSIILLHQSKKNMSGENTNPEFYKCIVCNYSLPTANYNYQEHSCFHGFNKKTDALYINNANQMYLVRSNATSDDAAFQEDSALTDEENLLPAASPEPMKGRKCDSSWAKYDELLISAIRDEPSIWDFTIPIQDRGPLKVTDAWSRVEVHLDGLFEVSDLKKRWRNLRDSYKKAKRKQRTYIASGSGSDGMPKLTFRHFESMSFLDDPQLAAEPTFSNVANCSEEQQQMFCDRGDPDEASSTNDHSTSSSSTKKHQATKRARSRTCSESFEESIMRFLESRSQRTSMGFFDSVEDMLSELPVSVRTALQIKILNLTLKAYNAHCSQNKNNESARE